jgi:hypothetical protein
VIELEDANHELVFIAGGDMLGQRRAAAVGFYGDLGHGMKLTRLSARFQSRLSPAERALIIAEHFRAAVDVFGRSHICRDRRS